jgi:hypothetical protein
MLVEVKAVEPGYPPSGASRPSARPLEIYWPQGAREAILRFGVVGDRI